MKYYIKQLLTLFLLLVIGAANAQNLTSQQLQAGYVYNFLKFISWPKESLTYTTKTHTICILDAADIAEILSPLQEDQNGSEYRVKVKSERFTYQLDLERCSILYIGTEKERTLQDVHAAIKDRPILTISAIPNYLNEQGMVEFITDKEKVLFNMHLRNLTSVGLKASSKLLRIADNVIK